MAQEDTQVNLTIIAAEDGRHTLGGKAANLLRLRDAGINVPRFVVIPAEVLSDALPSEIVSDVAEIFSYIDELRIDDRSINNILSQLPSVKLFSVRSSSVDEDGSQHSFAGQYESYLYVRPEAIADKIKAVWKSAFSERVFAYRKENGLSLTSSIAVIVQEMVDADVSGVAFGANPANGDRNEKVVSAVYGIGEGLVSGELDADTYYIKDGSIRRTIVRKAFARVGSDADSGGTALRTVDNALQAEAALTDDQILAVAALLEDVQAVFGTYQDIEFCFRANELFLLQSRPITTLLPEGDLGEETIWDNSNIIESYPGLTSPLTFSFILPVYEAVYRQFTSMVGVTAKEIEENREVFANMLGLIHGRVYYDLLNWYRALALLPGYSLNAAFMEKMMGVKEAIDFVPTESRGKMRELTRVARMGALLVLNLRRLPKMRTDFAKTFEAVLSEYAALDYETMSAAELMDAYLRFERTLLAEWKAPLVNDFFAMIYFGTLQKLSVRYDLPNSATIHNDLLCGAKDIISTEPIRRLLELSREIENDDELREFVLRSSEEEVHSAFIGGAYPNVARLFASYIKRFGERCVGELKLETITYSQNPLLMVRIIRSYVEQGIGTVAASSTESTIRGDAEQVVSQALSRSVVRRRLYRYVLNRSRELVSARENLRYERTRAFAVVRKIFCAIGERLQFEGKLRDARDVFYLTKTEISDAIYADTGSELLTLVDERRAAYEQYGRERLPERIRARTAADVVAQIEVESAGSGSSPTLKGVPCCAGVVRAIVQVVRHPNEVPTLAGRILVTSSTDPGWVTLFPSASAILVERGSLLSHSAIVAREMGKPCIVGITGLLQELETGDEIRLDGSTGIVEVLSRVARS